MIRWTATTGGKRPRLPQTPIDVADLFDDIDFEFDIRRNFYAIDPDFTAKISKPAPGNEDINDFLDIDPEEELNFH